MIQAPAQLPVYHQKPKWGSIAQFILCGIAAIGFLILAGFMAFSGISNQFNPSNPATDSIASLSLAWGFGLITLILALSALVAFLRLLEVKRPNWMNLIGKALDKPLLWLIVLWPVILAAGFFLANKPNLNWLLIPPFHLLAIVIPIIWLVHLGRRNLPTNSFQRSLGILSTGLVGSFLLALVAEIALIAILIVLVIIILSQNPNALFDLTRLEERISSSQTDPEAVMRALRPYLSNPMVIFGGLALLSGFVPLIEEFFKPLAVWLLKGKLLTPAEGFATGVLGGSGFALIESLGQVGSFNGTGWLGLEGGRGGTDLLHIFTAGMMGWALVNAWKNGKIWMLGVVYVAAIITHGLWNALVLGIGLTPFLNISPSSLFLTHQLEYFSPIGLGILFVTMMVFFLLYNRSLQTNNSDSKI
jgi:hypothetical protein